MIRYSKKGQFFLVAAIIIVFVLFGLVAVTNKITTKKTEVPLIDISKELQLESESTINYGIFSGEGIANKLETFTKDYSGYLGEDNQLFFVYGTFEKVTYVKYQIVDTGGITLDVGGSRPTIDTTTGELKMEIVDVPTGQTNIDVTVAYIKYNFELKEGENFFFVIQEPRVER